MRLSPYINQYKNILAEHSVKPESVTTGRDAWTIAHHVGITNHAYDLDRSINDSHIQTVLERLFPNAVFNDKKVY